MKSHKTVVTKKACCFIWMVAVLVLLTDQVSWRAGRKSAQVQVNQSVKYVRTPAEEVWFQAFKKKHEEITSGQYSSDRARLQSTNAFGIIKPDATSMQKH
jgi:beta-lactamase regulating signal transducer with metallopeptidase domain